MQNVIDDIVNELQTLLTKTKELESKYMGQILALEKVVNFSRKTVPEVIKRQAKKVEEVKQQLTKESIDSKVDAMLMEIEQKQKMLEHNPRQKLEIKTPEPIIQKKPPIPTANRVEKSNKTNFTTYVPPRNKNQVTGKVTQTTVKTNSQKVFKPQLTGMKKSRSRDFGSSQNMEKIEKNSVVKIEEKRQEVHNRPSSTIKNEKNTQIKPKKPQNKHTIAPKEELYVQKQLYTFHKNLEETLEEILSNGKKNRKHILEKMVRQCQKQETGHKKNEQINKLAFIKHVNNLAVSRNAVNPVFTHKITRSKWKYYPELFELNSILSSLQSEIGNIQNLKQYKLDPKQEYRIVQTACKMSQLLNKIQQDKSVVPDKLDLNFSHADISAPMIQKSDEMLQLSQLKLNEEMNNLLQQLSKSSELLKPQLKGLQVLTEVGIFKSKKSPIIFMQKQYSSWKKYYF